MCWFHHAITGRHSSPSAPVVWRRKRCRSELPKFLSRASLFASMTCVLRLSGGTVTRQLSTSVSLIAERKYTDFRLVRDPFHARVTCTDHLQRRCCLSALAPTRRNDFGRSA